MAFSDTITAQLSADLDADRVKTRSGGRAGSLSYVEGYDVIDTANRIFGFDGWHMRVNDVSDFGGVVLARVTITVDPAAEDAVSVMRGSVMREDVGVGLIQGGTPDAREMAVKTAVTDAMKRAFRTFGNQFGNSLYDKDSPLHNGNGAAPPARTAPNRTPATGATRVANPHADNGQRPQAGAGEISAAQIGFAKRLAGMAGLDADREAQASYGKPLARLSKREASAFIDSLKNAPPADAGAAGDDDIPF